MLRIIFYLAVAMLDLIGGDKDKEIREDAAKQEVVVVEMAHRTVGKSGCYHVGSRKP